MATSVAEAKRLQVEGDNLLVRGQITHSEKDIIHAELCYSQAIKLGPTYDYIYIMYARRSVARAVMGEYVRAVKDAEEAISLYNSRSTGYACKASALAALSHFQDAIEAYKKALDLDSGNVMLAKELAQVESAYDIKCKYLIKKLKAKPQTRDWLNDTEFLENVKKIAQGSWYLRENLYKYGDTPDWRLFHVDSIVSGLDKYITICGKSEVVVEDPLQATQDKSTSPMKAIEPEKPKHEDIPQDYKSALEEIDLGIDAYKKNDFDNALKHYQRAIELDPTNIIIYTKKAAVYFEQKEYEKCIKECEKAVEIGRKDKADCKLIAEAFTWIGHAYAKMEQWKLSMTYYEKSISEHQSPETKELLKNAETRVHVEDNKTD